MALEKGETSQRRRSMQMERVPQGGLRSAHPRGSAWFKPGNPSDVRLTLPELFPASSCHRGRNWHRPLCGERAVLIGLVNLTEATGSLI